MSDNNIKIRKMRHSDIPAGLELSMAEKWNQTKHDWEILLEGPGNISLIAEYDGKAVGTTTAINYANQVAWIGMVLVNGEYRGLGLSKLLLKEVLGLLIDCSSVKLDATPAGQPVYKKIGFEDEYIIHRMTRIPEANKKFNPERNNIPLPLQEKDLNEVVEMDKIIFGADRGMLIRELARNSPDLSWVIKENGKIVAFTLGRPGSRYTQIGPLCAQTDRAAKALISATFKGLENSPVVVDIPEIHRGLFEWLESKGFISQRLFTRMYLKENPFPGTPDRQFLICGPEFG